LYDVSRYTHFAATYSSSEQMDSAENKVNDNMCV